MAASLDESLTSMVTGLMNPEKAMASVTALAHLVDDAEGETANAIGNMVRDSGGFSPLLDLLDHPEEGQDYALRVIGNLASNAVDSHAEETRRLLHDLGAFPRVLPLIYSQSTVTIVYALGAVQNLLVRPEYALHMRDTRADVRLRALLASTTEERTQRFANGCLSNMKAVLEPNYAVPDLKRMPTTTTPTPPTEVSSLWLAPLCVVDRLICMRVCKTWQTLVRAHELWHELTLGEVRHHKFMRCPASTMIPFEMTTARDCGRRLEPGVPGLGDVEMNRMLSLPAGRLQKLTLISLKSITSRAFFALRGCLTLTSVAIYDCPAVDNFIAFALPASVLTLSLRCQAVTAGVASLLPPTVTTLNLQGSGLRRADTRAMKPPPGCAVDVYLCGTCDAPASKAGSATCERCTVTGCTSRAAEPSSQDGTVAWHRSSRCCQGISTCFGCDKEALCSDCDNRVSCQADNGCSNTFCDGCLDELGDCACCTIEICSACVYTQCTRCSKSFCESCSDMGDGPILCDCCDNHFCTDCKPMFECSVCGQYGCEDCCHHLPCGCIDICIKCIDDRRQSCSSVDCHNAVCESCSARCAGCEAAFCGECCASVDDDMAPNPHKAAERERLRRMGMPRPSCCGECCQMWCADCSDVRSCSFCGTSSSCSDCARVRQCDGCDSWVCLLCPEVDQGYSCCSMTAGWLGEQIELECDERAVGIWQYGTRFTKTAQYQLVPAAGSSDAAGPSKLRLPVGSEELAEVVWLPKWLKRYACAPDVAAWHGLGDICRAELQDRQRFRRLIKQEDHDASREQQQQLLDLAEDLLNGKARRTTVKALPAGRQALPPTAALALISSSSSDDDSDDDEPIDLTSGIFAGWKRKESSSYAGKFYYINQADKSQKMWERKARKLIRKQRKAARKAAKASAASCSSPSGFAGLFDVKRLVSNLTESPRTLRANGPDAYGQPGEGGQPGADAEAHAGAGAAATAATPIAVVGPISNVLEPSGPVLTATVDDAGSGGLRNGKQKASGPAASKPAADRLVDDAESDADGDSDGEVSESEAGEMSDTSVVASIPRTRLCAPLAPGECELLRASAPDFVRGFVELTVERTVCGAGGGFEGNRPMAWRSERVVVARLPITELSRLTEFRTSEWRVRLLEPRGHERAPGKAVRLQLLPPPRTRAGSSQPQHT